ncbi:hypothetical protein C1645_750373 [Glomus cerebriforme]|uniref:Sacsin/Nov domain-containing protein n=1 Tax=Glomus cerebriforme TaxID=658196 RepID=A0A397TMU5_9GLOM|nr:hypothetical protein C1645_750373 [Glomus cerebriforme]
MSFTLSSSNKEEVKVNQRCLVDKILARYSSEFVIYRELLQNSDDAKSTMIKIYFKTKDPNTNTNILRDEIVTILFKNDGDHFKPQDWNRIKEIAVGNPGDQKIGAFGVGFYSVFSVCDEPSIISGGQGMKFFWENNQLITEHGEIDKDGETVDEDQKWTTFTMHLRKPQKFPNVEEFTRFFSKSLGFTNNIKEIIVYFNDTQVIKLSRESQGQKSIDITSEFNTYSPNKTFKLKSLDIRDIRMNVERLLVQKENSEQQSLINDYQREDTFMVLKIADGNLEITVDKDFSDEMKRITKKDLPKYTTIHLMFTEFDGDYNKIISPTFKNLLPYPEQGQLYIGFQTQQTIGCYSNLSAHVIPSVERESIDLVNKPLKEFNERILYLTGVLCRILYENEMNKIKMDLNVENIEHLEKRAAHVLGHFTFNKSTPKESVGIIIEKQFFDCLNQNLPILSTQGILPISDVRIPDPKTEAFIKKVPIVPKIILEHCEPFFKKAKDTRLIEVLSFQDVLRELRSRSLSEKTEIIALLKWWISYRSEGNNTNSDGFTQFMQSAIFCIRDKPQALNTIHYAFGSREQNSIKINDKSLILPGIEIPIPDDVLPHNISENFENSEMEKYFQWDELPLVHWARFIVDLPELEINPTFAETVHITLAAGLKNLDISENDKNIIRELFICKKCIPTTCGMKNPDDAYLQDVDASNLFPDLPKIQFQKFFDSKNLMLLLGVNKVIKVDRIIDYASSGVNYNHMQLAKYLGSKLNDFNKSEWDRLKDAKIWPKYNSNDQHFIARELFVPLDLYREFLLPTIEWTEKWDLNTGEAKFLINLGLLQYPTLSKILKLSAPPTEKEIRNKALKSFIDNFEKYSHEYDPATIAIEFLPCFKPDVYAKPSECFINSDCAKMGFNVIERVYKNQAEKLGVNQHPDNEKLIKQLTENRPKSEVEAKDIFEYLETRRDTFTNKQLNLLSESEFIPIRNKEQNIIHKSPYNCFFKGQKEVEKIFGEFFLFIDFGKSANKFLEKCGVKNEPPAVKIAELLVESSREVWESVGRDTENYKFILQKLADDFNNIEENPDLITRMKAEPILLGVSEGKKYDLDSVENIYINDDAVYIEIYNELSMIPKGYSKFLYKCLGCKSLSESIKEKVEVSGNTQETKESQYLQKKLDERAYLFYCDYPKNFIRRNEEWLKKLKVKGIDKIEAKYFMKAKNNYKIRPVTACILEDQEKGIFNFYITLKPDYLDISKCLVMYIYKSRKSRDIHYLAMMLKAPLEDLKYSNNDSNQENSQCGVDKTEYDPQIDQNSTNYDSQLEVLFKSLRAMFEDCDHDYIYRCLQQAEEDKLINVENHLMEGNYPKVKIPVNPYDPPVTIKVGKTFMNVIQISRPSMGSYLNENQTIYCKNIKGYSLKFEKFLDGIEFHIPKDIDKSEIFSRHQNSLNHFAKIIKDLIEVFDCVPKFIRIFYDKSNLMAFNQDRALFFNFKIYLDLYKIEPTIDAMTYWYMVICHELAHKFVNDHNSEHEVSVF